MTVTALPSTLAALVASYIDGAGVDFTSPAAMRGTCEDHARGLARHIMARGLYRVDAYQVQQWLDHVPDALVDDEMAPGHYVTLVRCPEQGEEYRIDLTAAQFPALGWTGPRVIRTL